VLVLGRPAKVVDGVFSATAELEMGSNDIDVVATAAGADPVTATVAVTRGRSQAQLAAAAAAKRKRQAARDAARKRAAARAAARRAADAAATVTVPDEVGERLDIAEDDLRSRGLRYTEIGGGAFGIVVPSNWTVCETRPGAGAQVKKHGAVKLIVDREC
jgi:hypothetical protein